MARVSRRNKNTEVGLASERTGVFRTAIYVRLSKEDGDMDSIDNQTALLMDYVSRQEDMSLAATFVDNGFTGTNFDRPDFKRMMDKVKAGEINCIVVKDLSRLGRNYIEAGNYIEKLFPFLKVRFVAVNDRFDTKNGYDTSALIVPIKNMVNDVYAKDISKKIISTFRAKQKNGEYIGLAAPFGYDKDPENKNHFVIDPKAAETVRLIFHMRKEGKGTGLITKYLNEENISCPRRYRCEKGLASSDRYKEARWADSTVKRILTSEVYIGNTVQGKQKQELCNNIPKHRTKKSDWIVAENTHEPIIDKKLFYEVQEIMRKSSEDMKNRIKNVLPEEEREENFLIGHVKCGCCGKALVLKQYLCHGHIRREYACRTAQHEGENACKNRLGFDKHEIERIVCETINSSIFSLRDILNDRRVSAKNRDSMKQMTGTEPERVRLKLREKLGNLYEDYSEGVIEQSEYELLKQNYCNALSRLEERISIEKFMAKDDDTEWLSERLESFRKGKSLTRRMVEVFVNNVMIYGRDRVEVDLNDADAVFEAMKGE